jgi:hypothetical protein
MNEGPRPFSSEWLHAPAPPPEPPKRWNKRVNERIVSLLTWLPGARASALLAVMFLVVVTMMLGRPGADRFAGRVAAVQTPAPNLVFNEQPVQDEEDVTISTDSITVTEGNGDAPLTTPEEGPKITLDLASGPEVQDGSILPEYRILLFYGFPGDANMGILGEYDMARLMELLQEQAAAYEAADPGRPVKIAFEVIASIAQKEPQADGSYLLDAPSTLLDEYTGFTAENDMLLFFDVQIGRRTVQTEVEGLARWLEYEHVHLALDPEFSMKEGQIPGDVIGSVNAADITWTQEYLAGLTSSRGLPPKVLIVHQFTEGMIANKDQLAPVPGVQLVVEFDGWGTPDLKRTGYAATITSMPIEYNGIKLFYQQDQPLMTPQEVLDLSPVPDIIIYQ